MKKFVMMSLSVLCVLCVFANISAAKEMKFFHDNPEWQQNWSDMGALSEKTSGLKMVPTEFDTQVYKSRIKVDLTTSRAPAAFKWWFGYRAQELLKAGLLADLSDVWDEVGDNFAPGVREAMTQDGVAYGFPLHVSYWVWYYNKPLFEKLGIELPTTWDGFVELLASLKEQGISGIGNTIGQSRWTSFIIFEELLYRLDAEFYNKLMKGEAHWTDPTVVQAMEIWKDLLDKGYFAPMDTTYTDDFPRMFQEGELAFAVFGDWYGGILQQQGLVSGKDFDVYIPPAINPAGEEAIIFEISPLVAGKNSSELELGKEWFKWYASSPDAAQFMWEKFRFAPTTYIPLEELAQDDPARAHGLELVKAYPKKLIRFWEATPVEIVEQAVDDFNTMLVEPDKYMDLLNNIEKKAKETWPDYGVEY